MENKMVVHFKSFLVNIFLKKKSLQSNFSVPQVFKIAVKGSDDQSEQWERNFKLPSVLPKYFVVQALWVCHLGGLLRIMQ